MRAWRVHRFGSPREALQIDEVDEGRIRTVVGRTAPWTGLPDELTRLADRETVGRTVLDWR